MTEGATRQSDGANSPEHVGIAGAIALTVVILGAAAAHLGLLHLPYFWDETYFAPASRDLFLTGKLLPISVPVESHPPLVYAWTALWWKLFGFGIGAARTAMLAIAALTLVGVYRLARLLTRGVAVPIAVTVLTAFYPVFFSHSTMVQLDMAAAGLTIWGLVAYLEKRPWASAILFSVAVLSKETAIVGPMAILGIEVLLTIRDRVQGKEDATRITFPLLLSLVTLAAWMGYLQHTTGSAFGDPDYVKYNTAGKLRPLRVALALGQHLWHLLIYLNMVVLTGFTAVICAVRRRGKYGEWGGHGHAWLMLAGVTAGYLAMLSVVGGVTLARYLLPIYPMVVLASLAAISARVKWWPAVAAISLVAFVAGLFPYTNRFMFRRDDNLAYADFVKLQQVALQQIPNGSRVATIWPVSFELERPYLGYTTQAIEVLQVDSFSPEDLQIAKERDPQYLVMFPRSVCKVQNPLFGARWWRADYFRERDAYSVEDVAKLVNAQVVYSASKNCDSIAVLKIKENALMSR